MLEPLASSSSLPAALQIASMLLYQESQPFMALSHIITVFAIDESGIFISWLYNRKHSMSLLTIPGSHPILPSIPNIGVICGNPQ